ncbi:4-hydroxy-tetrahydrodipicolinate reductase [Tistrella mobilis]|uniref:4-hydroxy-tetrahydrodipicolinate reductase n=1 Tax=Tistrella mobilis TaxID=171437 RepID=UPI00355829AE
MTVTTPLRVCVAGVTGWTGGEIARAVAAAADLDLAGGIARSAAGRRLDELVPGALPGAEVAADVETALAAGGIDVLVDYTHPSAVAGHAEAALARGVHVVIGTSGLDAAAYERIAVAATAAGRGVVASGNFAITAALATRFSLIAARYIPHVEVVEIAGPAKPDAPSGTARELAERLGRVARPEMPQGTVPVAPDKVLGDPALRGGTIGGVQVHSLRLPSYAASIDAHFAVAGARLVISHDAGKDAKAYVDGTLLAIRKVAGVAGLVRGLDVLLFGPDDAAAGAPA